MTNPRDRVLAHVLPLLSDGPATVPVGAAAETRQMPPAQIAGVLSALVKEGRLVQVTSHRSGSGGRRKRARVLALP
jgi:hypothetical protein